VLTTRKDLVSEDDNLLFMNGNQFEEWLENDIPKDKKCFIIGGGQVYYEFIDQCDTIYMTTVDKSFDADTFFPDPYEYGFVKDDEPNDISLIKYGIHSDLISDDPEANIAWGILKLSRK
jgi:dihydrofolate reductase